MDLLYNHPCNNRLGYDCLLYIWHFDHKYWDKDQYISDLNKLYHKNIQNWQHILVYNQEDYRYKMADKSKLLGYWLLYIVSWDHMVKVGKDWHILRRQLNEKSYDYELFVLWKYERWNMIWGVSRMKWNVWWWILTFILFKTALSERIAGVTRNTCTRRKMIHNLANSIQATCSRTRILAFVSNTCKTWGTIGIQNAFRSTTFIRVSEIIIYTCASTCTVLFTTNGIWTARTRSARSRNFYRIVLSNEGTLTKRISSVST